MSEDKEAAKAVAERIEAENRLYGKCQKVQLVDPTDESKGTAKFDHSQHAWEWVWEDDATQPGGKRWTDSARCVNCGVTKGVGS